MKRHTAIRLTVLLLIVFCLPAAPAFAQPANDDFANAALLVLNASTSADIADATVEEGEPFFCYIPHLTVWYTYTTDATKPLRLTTSATTYNHSVQLYEAQTDPAAITNLQSLSCGAWQGGLGSLAFTAEAGKRYYIQIGSLDMWENESLTVSLTEIPPPLNDNFAGPRLLCRGCRLATPRIFSAATLESGEPTPTCNTDSNFNHSVWYTYTPAKSGSLTAWADSWFIYGLAVYTGGSVEHLSQVACNTYRMTFFAEAGVTYYFQVGSLFSDVGPLTFNLVVAPQPVAGFGWSPTDSESLRYGCVLQLLLRRCERRLAGLRLGLRRWCDRGGRLRDTSVRGRWRLYGVVGVHDDRRAYGDDRTDRQRPKTRCCYRQA